MFKSISGFLVLAKSILITVLQAAVYRLSARELLATSSITLKKLNIRMTTEGV